MTEPLIHPDCLDPDVEFRNRLEELIRDGKEAGLSDREIRTLLHSQLDNE